MRASAPGQHTDLVLEHRAYVLRLCRILLRDADDAEDAAQQILLRAYRALTQGVRPVNARAWLAQIARNECRSRRRTATSRAEVSLPEALPGAGLDPSELVAERELLARIKQELANLPERQRRALLLREIRGLSYGELAEAMHETQPAVESLLQRARRRLAKRLDEARRPLVGVAAAFDWTREALVRLWPGPAAAETAAAGGAAVMAAKVAVVGMVAVGVSATSGDVTHPPHAAPAQGTQIASRSSKAQSLAPRRSDAAPSESTALGGLDPRHRRHGGDDSRGDRSGSGSGRRGTSSERTDDASHGPGSSGSSSSGSGSGRSDSSSPGSSGSGSRGSGSIGSGSSGSGVSGSGSNGSRHSGSGSSGSGSDSLSSGPGTSSSGSGSSGSGSDPSSVDSGSGTSGPGD